MAKSAETALREAAAESFRRIDRDRSRASDESAGILDFIARHLFDPRLDVGWLLAGLSMSHNVSSRFKTEIGVGPRRYIEARRLETACRLLREMDLEVREVGERVGYRRFAAFSHAFNRRLGRRPAAYRAAYRAL